MREIQRFKEKKREKKRYINLYMDISGFHGFCNLQLERKKHIIGTVISTQTG